MRRKSVTILFIFFVYVSYAFCASHSRAQTAVRDSTVDSTKVKLQNKVVVIFKANCSVAGCHQGAYPKKKLNLESDKFQASVLSVSSQEIGSLKRVDTKNPEKSYLLMKIKGEKGIKGSRMPDDAPPLKKEEIKAIEAWIFSLKESNPEKEKTPSVKEVKNPKSSR
jgi:hypothetical protein